MAENGGGSPEHKELKNQKRIVRRQRRRQNYRIRQSTTSMFFLLWAVFFALSFVVIIIYGVAQRVAVERAYKMQTVEALHEEGGEIKAAVENGLPEAFGGSWSAYINYLSARYSVEVYLLDGEGVIVFPRNPHQSGEDGKEQAFQEEIGTVLEKLDGLLVTDYAIYEGSGEYVYCTRVYLYGDNPLYLYVAEPLDFLQSSMQEMTARSIILAVIMFVISLALSSTVSGMLTTPIAEMTKKARELANGDFDVDFHGKMYGAELVELAESLNFARDELSKTDKMQKELIANVSHDFKTPLTMIKGYASMIKEISGENKEKREKHAQIIVDEADRLASLVNDLLDLSKIRSGIAELNLEEIDTSLFVREILERFDYVKDTQGYAFEVEIESGLYTRADRVKIGQALYNLIGNAVNYTGEDKRVRVSLKRTGENVFRFSVQDTGEGIKAEELSVIWDRYYRVSETHKRPVSGTGLGLSIVKVVLERHGFFYGVESEIGKGSTFYVDFPIVTDFNTQENG